MVNTIKFSQFADANLSSNTYEFVGVSATNGGTNIKRAAILTWTNSTRPASPAAGLIGYNSDIQKYEYWSPVSTGSWVQLANGDDLINPGLQYNLAYYAAAGNTLSPIATAINGVLTTDASGIPSIASAASARTTLGLGNAALKNVSNNAQPTVPSLSGTFTSGHIAVFGDTAGTIVDGGSAPSGYQPLNSGLTAFATLSDGAIANTLPYYTGPDTFASTALTSNARTFIGKVLVSDMVAFLSLTPGTNVQAYSNALQALSLLTPAADLLPYYTGPGGSSTTSFTSLARTLIGQSTAASMCSTLNVTGKHAWPISIGAMYPALSSGATIQQVESSTFKNNFRGYSFVNGSTTYIHFRLPMPKSWNQSTITAQFYFKTSVTSGNVTFQIQSVLRNNGDSEDLAFGSNVSVTTTVAASSYGENISAETSAMTVAGTPANGSDIEFRISRSAGDTAAAPAILTGIVLNIITNAGNDA